MARPAPPKLKKKQIAEVERKVEPVSDAKDAILNAISFPTFVYTKYHLQIIFPSPEIASVAFATHKSPPMAFYCNVQDFPPSSSPPSSSLHVQ